MPYLVDTLNGLPLFEPTDFALFQLRCRNLAKSTIAQQLRRKSAPKLASPVSANEGALIPAAVAERMFDRFYRGEASRSNVNGNHGLGLSIVRAIAEMHRGSVLVRRSDGWNEFGLKLPISSTDD